MENIDNNILLGFNKILSSDKISITQKKYLLKLRKNYLFNISIENVEEKEARLYKDMGKFEKILFELDRIKSKVDEDKIKDVEIKKNFSLLSKNMLVNLINSMDEEELYDIILKGIIKIEVELGLKIGLFTEFNSFVKYEVSSYMDLVEDNSNLYDIDNFQYNNIKKRV